MVDSRFRVLRRRTSHDCDCESAILRLRKVRLRLGAGWWQKDGRVEGVGLYWTVLEMLMCWKWTLDPGLGAQTRASEVRENFVETLTSCELHSSPRRTDQGSCNLSSLQGDVWQIPMLYLDRAAAGCHHKLARNSSQGSELVETTIDTHSCFAKLERDEG